MASTGQQAPKVVTDNGVVLAFDPVVLADEQLLARGGFYKGTPNGYTDAAYEAAVRAARAVYPGVGIDDALRAKLRAITLETPDPVFPREGARVLEAQLALRDLGVYNGPASGLPNALFDAALRAFQIREGLPSYPRSATPILDDQALARLQLRAAEAKSRGTAPSPMQVPPPATPPPPVTTAPPVQPPAMTPPPVMMPPIMMPAPAASAMPVGAATTPASTIAVPIIAATIGVIAGVTWASFLFTRR